MIMTPMVMEQWLVTRPLLTMAPEDGGHLRQGKNRNTLHRDHPIYGIREDERL